ncbi:helix-turn-helix domain-containing protein [Actinacidiphila glaucinigra]|nr:helix-turn-helix domain-containing protein [Actinacidiphila glaucinigra]
MRMQAAQLFEQGIKPLEVARRLRVSAKSAYQWHQLWREGGVRALATLGPSGSRCRLSPRSLEKLAGYLAARLSDSGRVGPSRKDFVSSLAETEGLRIAWNQSWDRAACGRQG